MAIYLSDRDIRAGRSRYWRAQIVLSGRPGEPPIKSSWKSTKQTTKGDAKRIAEQWERETIAIYTGHAPAQTTTLRDAILNYEDIQITKGVKPITLKASGYSSSALGSILGWNTDISTLQETDLERFFKARSEHGNARSTCIKDLTHLLAILHRARKMGLYKQDPSDLWPHWLEKTYAARTGWLNPDQYHDVVGAIDEYFADHLVVYCGTGVRYSELYTITGNDVNLQGGSVHVDGTKTDGAKRWVPIIDTVKPVLERRLEWMRASGVDLASPIFPIDTKSKATDRYDRLHAQRGIWMTALNNACDSLKVKRLCTNDLRRTFCTTCRSSGVDKDTVVKWMGHTSSKMVDTVYCQPDFEHYKREAQKVSFGQQQETLVVAA
jgi:integrase